MTTSAEKVLVIPTESFAPYHHYLKDGIITDPDVVANIIADLTSSPDLFYLERYLAENDEDFLQLIPYTLVWRGRELFHYQRSSTGTETRLEGKWSVGVGGHINPEDSGLEGDVFEEAWKRELLEEVGLTSVQLAECQKTVTGIIHDRSTPVGRVHLGIVTFLKVPLTFPLVMTDPALQKGETRHVLDLVGSDLDWETWSKLVLASL